MFVIGKIRITEFHQPHPPTENFDDSPYPYGTSQMLIHFCKKMRYRVNIKKSCLKKITVATPPPFKGRELSYEQQDSVVLCNM